MNDPVVSVIVPHYRDFKRLDLCLAALECQTYPSKQFEIVVADNASPEGEARVAETIAGRARLTVVSEKGAAPARNGGVALARGRLLAFTDSDCLPDPEWLAAGVKALEHHDFVGGCMHVTVNDEHNMTPVEAFERVFAFHNDTYVKRKGFSVTANLFCARDIFEHVGGFRGGMSEDIDWCLRASAAGYRIGYAASARVGHPARITWEELVTKSRRINREVYGLAKTSPGGPLRWLIRSLCLPLSAVLQTPQVLVSPRLSLPRDRVSAIVVLFRIKIWSSIDSMRLVFAHGKR